MREVWGDAFVTDEVMSHAVWELRKAFSDEARNPRYIQTLTRRGYRLVAEVSRCASPEPLAPGSRIGQYEILEPVGGGAMGEVYKARDTRLGRTVALKFLPADLGRDPSARKRFRREAQAVAQLDHPNVASIYDMGETEGGRLFLALAFYEGETLQQKLERGPLPLPEALGIACQIAKGLAAAHQRKIVHRDIKPANIAVLPDGMVKILDFGLAKMSGATTLTRLGSSPGTPAYKSPEQTKGEPVDPRSDLWALGVVLYEMVAGRCHATRGERRQWEGRRSAPRFKRRATSSELRAPRRKRRAASPNAAAWQTNAGAFPPKAVALQTNAAALPRDAGALPPNGAHAPENMAPRPPSCA